MKRTKLLAGALALMMGAPALAQTEPVIINGSLIDWYYYGRDIHDGTTGWNQQTTGMGTEENPYNYGLISLGTDPAAEDGKTVWVQDFPIRDHLFYGNSGGVFTGDAYYTFFMHETEESVVNMDSEYGSEGWEVVVRKWDLTTKKGDIVARIAAQPIDLTYDPVNDVVYGVFYDGTAYKFGTIDMTTFKITTFSREGTSFGAPRCIAINSKGELYAIDPSGYLYKVDTKDGSLTTIGETGVKSQQRMMSATFDFRTDKLYWIGYKNNGKQSNATDGTNNTLSVADGGRDTGVYEVDTKTGKATLIGDTEFADVDMTDPLNPKVNKYGKMQLTGIYVEGAFTKKDFDLKADMGSYTPQLKVNEKQEVVVKVKNIGLQSVGEDAWSVVLYANGEEVARKSGRDLEKSEVREVKFEYTAPAKAGSVTLQAKVVYEADEQQVNNDTEEVQVKVLNDKLLPTVELQGTTTGSGITLNWQNPNGRVVDGAEEYIAFSYDGLGSWTMYDGDKGYTQKPNDAFSAVSYPNWNTPKAYIVFNPEQAGINLTGSADMFKPYQGDQFFAAFFTAVPDNTEAGGHQVANDDYMISPELSGAAQTISFWAKGYKGSVAAGYETEANYPETMEVLYTTGDATDPTTGYEVAKTEFTVSNDQWTKYTVGLPAGATHFALHCTSKEGFVLMVDDIEFQAKATTPTGYNVYCDGKLVKTLTASELTYADASAAQDAVYTVTALYGEDESAASNEVSINIINAIDEVLADAIHNDASVKVFNMRGQQVQHMQQPGLYIIKQGSKTRKVVVK